MAKNTLHHHADDKLKAPPPTPIASGWLLFLIGILAAKACLSPLRQPMRLFLLLLSLWLGIGSIIFGTAYLTHLQQLQARSFQRAELAIQESDWQAVLRSHPTSREALLGAYAYAVALGENNLATQYKLQLERIDPNDPRIKLL